MQTNNTHAILIALALYSALSVGFNLTIWAVADKYDLWGKYDFRLSHKFGERCMLCIPFWFAILYTLPVALISGGVYLLLMLSPFITAGITLKIAGKK
jgi:hypothetical protein